MRKKRKCGGLGGDPWIRNITYFKLFKLNWRFEIFDLSIYYII